jgi:hypothetical protein
MSGPQNINDFTQQQQLTGQQMPYMPQIGSQPFGYPVYVPYGNMPPGGAYPNQYPYPYGMPQVPYFPPGGPDAGGQGSNRVLYIGNVHPEVNEQEQRTYFNTFGDIENVKVLYVFMSF